MGFKDLTPEEHERRFATLGAAALERFGIPAEASLTLLSHRENAVFRVDDLGGGRPCVLRLHREGYPSVGCAPCSRAIAPGDDPRAGRWWWESPETRECGIHVGEEDQGSGI